MGITDFLTQSKFNRKKVEDNLISFFADQVCRELGRIGFSHQRHGDQPDDLIHIEDCRLTYASEKMGSNSHPESWLDSWDDRQKAVISYPLGSAYFWIDSARLPYQTSVEKLLASKDDIEINLQAAFFIYGIRRVVFQGFFFKRLDRYQLEIRLIWRELEIHPNSMPQKIDFEQAYDDLITKNATYNRAQIKAWQDLIKRLIVCAINDHNGNFSIRKIHAAFSREISYQRLVELALKLENDGTLLPGAGPKPRRVNPEKSSF
jgi:hypothetical protein